MGDIEERCPVIYDVEFVFIVLTLYVGVRLFFILEILFPAICYVYCSLVLRYLIYFLALITELLRNFCCRAGNFVVELY